MRSVVLPRDVSARVITNSVARAAGAVNAVSLTLTVPMLIEFVVERGIVQRPPLPFIILIVLVVLSILLAVRPSAPLVGVFLVVGFVGAVLFQLTLLSAYPQALEQNVYLLNRPAVALVLVGVTASSVRAGLAWSVGGFALSNLATVTVSLIADVPFTPGYGPVLTVLLMVATYLVLAAIQSSLRRRVPNFDALEREALRDAHVENLRMRVTSAVHDTLLNDLSLVMNAPVNLDYRMTDRLREDAKTLTGAEWLSESSEVVLDHQDSELRNRVMILVSEMQWRGLTVHITGNGAGIYRLHDDVAVAAVDATRVCLENVLRHSGVTIAELDLVYGADGVTIMVTDQGCGFDVNAMPADRIGLRISVEERVRALGGSVKIWSTAGEGTSIVITLPVVEVVTENEEWHHGDA